MPTELAPGAVVWVDLTPTRGREQSGRRPALVISGENYLAAVTSLAIVVPITTVRRDWPNHVLLSGEVALDHASWAMTEQPRTVSRERLVGSAGVVSNACLVEVRRWIADHLDLSS